MVFSGDSRAIRGASATSRRDSRGHLWGIAAIALAFVISACGGADPGDGSLVTGTLIVTTASGATEESSELDGSSVSGTIHMVVDVNRNVDVVRFHLDDASDPFFVARAAPFAVVLDTTELADGPHVVSARVPSGWSGNTREITRAEFTVANSDPTPAPEEPQDPVGLPGEPEDPVAPPDEPEGPVTAPNEPQNPSEVELFVALWGSDAAAGSLEEPLFSLRRAAELARPGDTIVLRGGVYDVVDEHVYVAFTLWGEADAPITVRSYPGEMAIFDGHLHEWHPRYENDGRNVTDPNLVRVIGDHLVWEDITFRNGVGRGFYFVGHHNVLRRVVSHGHHADGVYFQGSYNLLEYVTVYDNNSVSNGGNSASGIKLVDGVHIRNTHGPEHETRGNMIRYALVYQNSDDGIDVWSSWDTLIEYSVAFGNGIGPTGDGRGFKLGGSDRHDIGTVARFNVAFDNAHSFDTNGSTGVLLYNNTSWRPRGRGFTLTKHSTNACANEAYNNISYEKGSYDVAIGDCTVHEDNSWNLGISEPLFLSLEPASPDFLSLSAASPARDVGRDMGFPFDGSGPDLGAVQYGERVTVLHQRGGAPLRP